MLLKLHARAGARQCHRQRGRGREGGAKLSAGESESVVKPFLHLRAFGSPNPQKTRERAHLAPNPTHLVTLGVTIKDCSNSYPSGAQSAVGIQIPS